MHWHFSTYRTRVKRPLAVLLVGEDQQDGVLELLLLQHGHELLLGHAQAVRVARVHHEDDGVRVGVVAAPVRPDGRLSAQVPHLELDVLVLQHLHVEADGGDGLDRLVAVVLQPVYQLHTSMDSMRRRV